MAISASGPFVELLSLRSFSHWSQAAHTRLLCSRGSVSAGWRNLASAADFEPPQFDPNYKSPTEVIWPATKQQERFAKRLVNALTAVLTHDGKLKERLVTQLGFAVQDVRMSPDNLKAFIQWDSFTGQHTALKQELAQQMPRLKSALARALRARNMPQLVFKHDSLTAQQQQVEDIFQQMEAEQEEDEGSEFEEGEDEDTEADEDWGAADSVEGEPGQRPTQDY